MPCPPGDESMVHTLTCMLLLSKLHYHRLNPTVPHQCHPSSIYQPAISEITSRFQRFFTDHFVFNHHKQAGAFSLLEGTTTTQGQICHLGSHSNYHTHIYHTIIRCINALNRKFHHPINTWYELTVRGPLWIPAHISKNLTTSFTACPYNQLAPAFHHVSSHRCSRLQQ